MLEWLGNLIPKELKLSLKLDVHHLINIQVVKIEGREDKRPIIVDGDKLIVNDTTDEGKKLANDVIEGLPENLEHNDAVLEEGNAEGLAVLDSDINGSNYDETLARYKGVVPAADIPILEVAILIAIKYAKGENVSQLKSQVVQRAGNRGPRAAMICNLYSSGYFESLILPLYQSAQEGKMALDEYLQTYEMIVTESPLAMFVGVGITRPKAKTLLLEKISLNKESEVGYLNIHGIGDNNIRVIKSLLNDAEVKEKFTEDPTFKFVGNSVKVTIYI
jgi:hypothetical protein